jgi:hypothetical protein
MCRWCSTGEREMAILAALQIAPPPQERSGISTPVRVDWTSRWRCTSRFFGLVICGSDEWLSY